MKRPLTFGSVCSGVGGIDLGFEWAGMFCEWQIEIDPFCRKLLKQQFPTVKRFTDVKTVETSELSTVDLIAGGIPCQPHSVGGKRRGKDDKRNLWPDFYRLTKQLKPYWVVIENVQGIITTMLDQIILDLQNGGYTTGVYSFPASALGSPQNRRRVFIVGNAYNIRQTAPQVIRSHSQGSNGYTAGAIPTFQLARSDCQQGSMGSDQGWGIGKSKRTFCPDQWESEPPIPRMVNGLPHELDENKRRIKALANSVVPEAAFLMGSLINQVDQVFRPEGEPC